MTFGHVGIVQKGKKAKKSARLFLHIKARWPLTGPRAEKRAAAPSIPGCRHVDCFRQCAALKKCSIREELQLQIKLGLLLGLGEQAWLFGLVAALPARVRPEKITMFGMTVYLS